MRRQEREAFRLETLSAEDSETFGERIHGVMGVRWGSGLFRCLSDFQAHFIGMHNLSPQE